MFALIKRFLLTVMAGFLALSVIGCGAAGNPSESATTATTSTTTTTAPAASLLLLTSSPQLSSNGEESVTLTALARDSSQNAVEGVVVAFAIRTGSVGTIEKVGTSTTDGTGTATALLKAKPSKENRIITVYATADGSTSNDVNVTATGTTVSISGNTTAVSGGSVVLTVLLKDASGVAIADQAVAVTSTSTNNTNTTPAATDSNGQSTFTVTTNETATVTVTAFDNSVSATHTISVSANDVLKYTSPAANTEIKLSALVAAPQQLNVSWLDAVGAAKPDGTYRVTFAASRGTLTACPATPAITPPTVALTGGVASICITSTTAGPAVITAKGEDLAGNLITVAPDLAIEFVADTPTQMTLQPSPAGIGVNEVGGTSEKSEIIATVRDANFNVVKNQTVFFNLSDTTAGTIYPPSAVTDSFGRATTTFTAGQISSPPEGVTITATITGVTTATAKLTVADTAVRISIGTTNILEIRDGDNLRYYWPFTILVTDSLGHPKAGATVTLSLLPSRYFKGSWNATFDNNGDFLMWVQNITATCGNEDTNFNNFFDNPGDSDTNNNGKLEPGQVATLSPGFVTTSSTGFADFYVVYSRRYAAWDEVTLKAVAVVDGTESTESRTFTLGITDLETLTDPPQSSPWGLNAVCTDLL